MRTLVYEPRVGGHFLNLAGQVASALSQAGSESHIAVSANAPGRLEYESAVEPLRGSVQIHATIAFDDRGSARSIARRSYAELTRLVLEIRPDRVYLPTGDAVVQLMGIARLLGRDGVLKRTHVEVLLMNGAVGHPELLTRREHWKRRISYRVAKLGCHTLYHLNPFVPDWERSQGIHEGAWARTMPDPVEVVAIDKAEARRALGLPLEARIAGMVGRLDRRKGADVLIQAFSRAALGPRDHLLLWGPCAPEVRPELDRVMQHPELRERVLFRDTVLGTDEFYQAIAAMDLLALPYTSPIGSSSIVIRAAAAGRPVVTTSGGWAGRVLGMFPLGWTFDGPDPTKLAAILPSCLAEAENWVRTASVSRFVEYNSPRNFAAHWADGFRAANGLPRDVAYLSWREMLAAER
jgi:glycosyltransferase involved in cell wall biosynthesis